MTARPAPPAVIHLDEALLVVDKPAGRIVIPGRSGDEPSLRAELEAVHGPLWVVHRLDRGTSGVLVFARTAAAHRSLNLQFERGEPRKAYLALVAGLPPAELLVEVALAPARRGRMRPAAAEDPRGKPASTTFERLEAFPAAGVRPAMALVEARPATGRTHQIRVHLRAAGHPLVFDPDYGEAVPLLDAAGAVVLARTPLHAARLELTHPAGRPLSLAAGLPGDLAATLAFLRG